MRGTIKCKNCMANIVETIWKATTIYIAINLNLLLLSSPINVGFKEIAVIGLFSDFSERILHFRWDFFLKKWIELVLEGIYIDLINLNFLLSKEIKMMN